MFQTSKKTRRLHTLRSVSPDNRFTLITSIEHVKLLSSDNDVITSYLVLKTSLYEHDLPDISVNMTEFKRSIFDLPESSTHKERKQVFAKQFKIAQARSYKEHTHYQEVFNCFNV